MKIVAGIGSIDDYEMFVEAGADELFCGYVPGDYMLKFGRSHPLNRREVIYYNVQIGSESELLILRKMIEKQAKKGDKVPVSITINALTYKEEQRAYIVEMVKKCIGMGFDSFIVAEPELLKLLENIEGIKLIVSGESGEMNSDALRWLKNRSVCRFIFPRQTTIEDMNILCGTFDELEEAVEYEAFALNEKCHFTGAFCNSLHCDELCHICKLPYMVADKYKPDYGMKDNDEISQPEKECLEKEHADFGLERQHEDFEGCLPGETGCALCHLWKMREAGVTHLKLVSRGNAAQDTCDDIRTLRRAIQILDNAENEQEYITQIFRQIFPKGCSKNCYAGI